MPDRITSLAEMAGLPVLTRQAVAQDTQAFVADDVDRASLSPRRSGGSTGEPLNFFVTPRGVAVQAAAEFWGNMLSGYRLGDPLALLWGSHYDAAAHANLSTRQRLVEYLGNIERFVTDRMDVAQMQSIIERLNTVRPRVVVGYTGPLVELARYMRDHDIKVNWPARSLISAAEPLYPVQRRLLESVFGKSVFDRYGSREAGLIANECDRHDGLHLNGHGLWVDLHPTADLGPDGAKSLLVTKLHEYGMPMIRYELGDYVLGDKGLCACGRGWPVIGRIRGRRISALRQYDGAAIAGEVFIALLDFVPVREYRVVQEADYSVRLELVCEPSFTQADGERILQVVRGIIGSELPLRIERCQRIERTASGKLLPVVSHVAGEAESAVGDSGGPRP
jgi:phenylacetate-CoA ligase